MSTQIYFYVLRRCFAKIVTSCQGDEHVMSTCGTMQEHRHTIWRVRSENVFLLLGRGSSGDRLLFEINILTGRGDGRRAHFVLWKLDLSSFFFFFFFFSSPKEVCARRPQNVSSGSSPRADASGTSGTKKTSDLEAIVGTFLVLRSGRKKPLRLCCGK